MSNDNKKETKKKNPIKYENELFKLIKKNLKYNTNGIINNERNIPELRTFVEQCVSSQLLNINWNDSCGYTPLMMSIWECINMEQCPVLEDEERHVTEGIMILLENGADINMQIPEKEIRVAYSGETALHLACSFITSNIVRLLLCHGANTNLQDTDGVTSLLISIRYSKYDTMKVLLENGADVNIKTNRGSAPIHEILYTNRYYDYQRIYRTSHFYNNDNDQNVIHGVRLLLEHGTADINIQNEDGATPLFLAVSRNWECSDYSTLTIIIQLFLTANANVSIPLKKAFSYGYSNGIVGDTTLHLAVRNIESIKLIQLLLLESHHPNLGIYNSNNETILDIAIKKRLYLMIDLIKEEIRNQMYKYLVHRWAPIKKVPITSPNKIKISTSTHLVMKRKLDHL